MFLYKSFKESAAPTQLFSSCRFFIRYTDCTCSPRVNVTIDLISIMFMALFTCNVAFGAMLFSIVSCIPLATLLKTVPSLSP